MRESKTCCKAHISMTAFWFIMASLKGIFTCSASLRNCCRKFPVQFIKHQIRNYVELRFKYFLVSNRAPFIEAFLKTVSEMCFDISSSMACHFALKWEIGESWNKRREAKKSNQQSLIFSLWICSCRETWKKLLTEIDFFQTFNWSYLDTRVVMVFK